MTTSTDLNEPGAGSVSAERRLWNEVIALFYESPGSGGSQQQFLLALSRLFDAEGAAFFVWADGDLPVMRAVATGLDSSELEAEFRDRAGINNLFSLLGDTDDQTAIGGRLGRRPTPGLSERHWLAGVLENDGLSRSAALVLRPANAAPLGDAARQTMGELLGYLKRGLRHNRLFERYRHSAQAGSFLMDRAIRGILWFSPRGAVTYQNAEARRVLDDGDGIHRSGDEIRFLDSEADQRFRDFLAGARMPQNHGSVDDVQLGLSLRADRPSGRSAYQLVFYRMPTGLTQATLDRTLGLVACVIHDPEQGVDLSGESLGKFFNLTPAEARLAVALLREHRLPDAAEHLGISINTARTQLKSVFQKLGVNSQPAMMQRLTKSLDLRKPPDLPDDGSPGSTYS